jgi:hypothetical protein
MWRQKVTHPRGDITHREGNCRSDDSHVVAEKITAHGVTSHRRYQEVTRDSDEKAMARCLDALPSGWRSAGILCNVRP